MRELVDYMCIYVDDGVYNRYPKWLRCGDHGDAMTNRNKLVSQSYISILFARPHRCSRCFSGTSVGHNQNMATDDQHGRRSGHVQDCLAQ